jgi:hypothetical protein
MEAKHWIAVVVLALAPLVAGALAALMSRLPGDERPVRMEKPGAVVDRLRP